MRNTLSFADENYGQYSALTNKQTNKQICRKLITNYQLLPEMRVERYKNNLNIQTPIEIFSSCLGGMMAEPSGTICPALKAGVTRNNDKCK